MRVSARASTAFHLRLPSAAKSISRRSIKSEIVSRIALFDKFAMMGARRRALGYPEEGSRLPGGVQGVTEVLDFSTANAAYALAIPSGSVQSHPN